MLVARRNCFLGRSKGFEVRREWFTGDPLQRVELMFERLPFCLEGIFIPDSGLLADFGLGSLGGDESEKHSSRDADVVVESLLLTGPNRNGGMSAGLLRDGIELVE